jgi:hypothetical protein
MKNQVSWSDYQANKMFDYIVKQKKAGVSQKMAYERYAAIHVLRTARSVESKYQKMLSIKKGGGTGNRELPNKPKKKGTLTMVSYYAKSDTGVETLLGTGPENAVLAVIKAFQQGSSVAQ